MFLNLPYVSKILIFGFLFTYVITFTLSDSPWQQQLYGRENRRNGLLTYLSLLLLFLVFHLLPYTKNLKVFINRISLAGVIVILYSILQLLGLDPFKWDSVNLHFFSTLGNPNFLSAYIAIVAIPILTWIYLRLSAAPFFASNNCNFDLINLGIFDFSYFFLPRVYKFIC